MLFVPSTDVTRGLVPSFTLHRGRSRVTKEPCPQTRAEWIFISVQFENISVRIQLEYVSSEFKIISLFDAGF